MGGAVRTEEFKREVEKLAERFGAEAENWRVRKGKMDGARVTTVLLKLVEPPADKP
jgi:hypothetical protein